MSYLGNNRVGPIFYLIFKTLPTFLSHTGGEHERRGRHTSQSAGRSVSWQMSYLKRFDGHFNPETSSHTLTQRNNLFLTEQQHPQFSSCQGKWSSFKAKSRVGSFIKNQWKQDLENYLNKFVNNDLIFACANLKTPLWTYQMWRLLLFAIIT